MSRTPGCGWPGFPECAFGAAAWLDGHCGPFRESQQLTGEGVFPQTLDGPEKTVVGAKELGAALAASSQARECFVSQFHAALTDRDSNGAERTALDTARRKFVASGDLHQLVTDLMTNAATTVRF